MWGSEINKTTYWLTNCGLATNGLTDIQTLQTWKKKKKLKHGKKQQQHINQSVKKPLRSPDLVYQSDLYKSKFTWNSVRGKTTLISDPD